MPETPQDHKPKADAPFTFKASVTETDKDGKPVTKVKSFTLPLAGKGAEKIPGGLTMDAIMAPDDGTTQLRLGFATLQAAGPSDAALAAFRSLSTEDMLKVLGEWMGESSGSSD